MHQQPTLFWGQLLHGTCVRTSHDGPQVSLCTLPCIESWEDQARASIPREIWYALTVWCRWVCRHPASRGTCMVLSVYLYFKHFLPPGEYNPETWYFLFLKFQDLRAVSLKLREKSWNNHVLFFCWFEELQWPRSLEQNLNLGLGDGAGLHEAPVDVYLKSHPDLTKLQCVSAWDVYCGADY